MKISKVLRTARIASWTYRILSLICGFAVIRIVNEGVGIQGYGTVAFVLAIYAALVSIDFGVLQSVSRFVARYQAPALINDIGFFWATLIVSAGGLALLQWLVLLVGLCLSGVFDFDLSISAGDFVLLGVLSVVANVLTLANSIFAGYQQYGLATSAKILRVVLYVAVVGLLWQAESLNVISVLWASVGTSLVSNILGFVMLAWFHGRGITLRWRGFPSRHQSIAIDVLGFSLFGWLITLSSIAVTSGSVVLMGTAFSLVEVAQLQIAIVLLNGIKAFMTGGMTPLTTIAARCSDDTSASRSKRASAIGQLLGETIFLSAIVFVFLIFHLTPFVGLLLNSEDRVSGVLSSTILMVLLVMLPCIASMPFYLFKYALVSNVENAFYGRQIAWITVLFLVLGFGIAVLDHSSYWIGIAIGGGLLLRSLLAYRLGRHNMPQVSMVGILLRFGILVLVFSLFSYACSSIPIDAHIGEFGPKHFHGMLFAMLSIGFYFFRRQISSVLRFR